MVRKLGPFLSSVGKVVLTKSNLISKCAYKEMDNINRNFFDKILIVIILNIILSTPFLGTKFEKCESDLGIRKTEDTNASFLTKQG